MIKDCPYCNGDLEGLPTFPAVATNTGDYTWQCRGDCSLLIFNCSLGSIDARLEALLQFRTFWLLKLYSKGQLPKGVRLLSVTFRGTAYGDMVIVDGCARLYKHTPPLANSFECEREDIELKPYRVDGRTMVAGYGRSTKALVIGKEIV